MFGFGKEDTDDRLRYMQMVMQQDQAARARQLSMPQETKPTTKGDPSGYLSSRLASSGIGGDAAARLAAIYNSSLAGNPDMDPTQAYESAFTTAQGDWRNQLMGSLNSRLPQGFETQRISDTMDDQIIESILGRQQGSAQEAIDRASSRGQLNAAGLNAATTGLSDAATAARAYANDLGMGVLSKYRTDLAGAADALRNQINSTPYGSTFNLDPAIAGIESKAAGYGSQLQGDITAALGDRNFFDTGKIIGTAGAQQGFINPGKIALAAPPNPKEQERRTIASSGVF